MISEERIRSCLTTSRFGRVLHLFRSLGSTNDHARELAESGAPEGTVVVAEEQTAGRGRLGRSWTSSPGENLTFSIILRDPPQRGSGLLPLAVGVALARAIDRNLSVRVQCKWPNDLLLEGRKLAGILMETSVDTSGRSYVIVGIGINVNQTFFPEEIRDFATSLKSFTRGEVDREPLLCACLGDLETMYTRSAPEGFRDILTEWNVRSALVGRTVTVTAGSQSTTGVVQGISLDGALVLRAGGTDRRFFAGDVTITKEFPHAARH